MQAAVRIAVIVADRDISRPVIIVIVLGKIRDYVSRAEILVDRDYPVLIIIDSLRDGRRLGLFCLLGVLPAIGRLFQ